MVLPSPRGTRVQTAPLGSESGTENNREVHSSPPVVSFEDCKEWLRMRMPCLQNITSFFSIKLVSPVLTKGKLMCSV